MAIHILGIDPGSRFTGFAALKVSGDHFELVRAGVFTLDAEKEFSRRLLKLSQNLQELVEVFRPHYVVVEKIFLGRNADSAFKLGHARGVVLCEGQRQGAKIVEYATRSVKKGVVGTGAADKEQVALALRQLLGLRVPMSVDASDALAMAYFHASELIRAERMGRLTL